MRTEKINGIELTRINNDVNGNPRYVVHFLDLLTEDERDQYGIETYNQIMDVAVERAKKIGGKKYRAKWYGGGIVFQSYNTDRLTENINELVMEAEKPVKRLRTNSKEVRQAIRKHLIERITADGQSVKEAVETIEDEFNHWYHADERKRTPNRQEAFISWAWGLPGCYNPLFETYKILEFMKSIGLPLPSDKEPTDGCNVYMYLMYKEYEKLKNEVQG